MTEEKVIESDVLVIGGGMAGCFAAIRAKEQGLSVILVEKGYVGRSGATSLAAGLMVFNPDWGNKLDMCMERINSVGEYVNNRDWAEIIFKESYARYEELLSWGVEFNKDTNGRPITNSMGPGYSESLQLTRGQIALVLRKQLDASDIEIRDRVMITDLIKQDGGIAGALGFDRDSNGPLVFKARATVLCAGTSSFKPFAFPVSGLTGDGAAMAYRAGAEITGKEFNFTTRTSAERPAAWIANLRSQGVSGGAPALSKFKNVLGDELPGVPGVFSLNMEFETHAGRAPIYSERPDGKRTAMIGGAASGASVHMSEGIWPANTQGATSLPGLYAAGESYGMIPFGATYPGGGMAFIAAAVSGARAGLGAAEYARSVNTPVLDGDEIVRLTALARAPLERKGGFSPGWVTQVLKNAVIPYFILFIKRGDRMNAALTMVEFMRDHLSPKMFARDPHELRLAHEAKNMVLNAEMKLRASLFRTESRGTHYREDYPRRDDPEWLAWVLLKEENGRMKAYKKPVPREWWPDLSIPYEERYPARFPGE